MHSEEVGAAVVALNLQVILAPDGDHWIAQAIEIDYAAAGDSKADVKQRFEAGLKDTISEHLQRFASLDHLLIEAPANYWRDLVTTGQLELFSSVSIHEFRMPPGLFPFHRINYFAPHEAQVAAVG